MKKILAAILLASLCSLVLGFHTGMIYGYEKERRNTILAYQLARRCQQSWNDHLDRLQGIHTELEWEYARMWERAD